MRCDQIAMASNLLAIAYNLRGDGLRWISFRPSTHSPYAPSLLAHASLQGREQVCILRGKAEEIMESCKGCLIRGTNGLGEQIVQHHVQECSIWKEKGKC